MFKIIGKKRNLIEVDDQTMFLLKVAAKANASTVPWVTITEGGIVRNLVENNLVPQDPVLYDRVMTLVTDAMMTGEKDDYRSEMSTLFDFCKRSLNLDKYDIESIAEHVSTRTIANATPTMSQFAEFGAGMSAKEIVETMAKSWDDYRHNPNSYTLINELIRIDYTDKPVKLFDVMEWYTIVTIRPFEIDKSTDPGVVIKGLFDEGFEKYDRIP